MKTEQAADVAICGCGCGQPIPKYKDTVKSQRLFIEGHRVRCAREQQEKIQCACGCGEWIDRYDSRGREHKFLYRHQRKNRTNSEEHNRRIGRANKEANRGNPLISGPNCHFWKGGVTPENQRIRTSSEYKDWRQAVFEKDEFTCSACGDVGGNLEAHHIFNFADYPELRFELSNGVSMHRRCHYLYADRRTL